MNGFEIDGCPILYDRLLKQILLVEIDLENYKNGSTDNDTSNQYYYITQKYSSKIQSLKEETSYLLNRCKAGDYNPNGFSLERPARLLEFLYEWNSTLTVQYDVIYNDLFRIPIYGPSNNLNSLILDKDLFSFKDCNDDYCLEMITIPSGTFIMGGTDEEHHQFPIDPMSYGWDTPLHEVTFKNRFAIGKYEVTRKQFNQFIKETGHRISHGCTGVKLMDNGKTLTTFNSEYNIDNTGFTQNDNHPIVCITAYDARAFAVWYSKKTNQKYRLPTESEWEYVARANQGNNYFIWGNSSSNDLACKYANIYDYDAVNSLKYPFMNFNCSDGSIGTSEVGKYLPNQFGVYDLTGNVREWVDDCWHYGYNGAPTDGSKWGSDWNGLCNFPIVRGGSFAYTVYDSRIAYRNAYFSSQSRVNMFGFRLVRQL